MITADHSWVLCMSPLQAKLFSEAECLEADVTYKASIEFEYLLNAVVFNYTTLRCKCAAYLLTNHFYCSLVNDLYKDTPLLAIYTGHVVARVRMNHLTANAYRQAFGAMFETVQSSHLEFKVGETLKGIILDWSDQQLSGLEAAVRKEAAENVTKGCQVHFTRSVKRVAERVNKGDPQGCRLFTTVAYAIPKAATRDDISKMLSVVAGEASISTLAEVECLRKTVAAECHTPKAWTAAKHWVNWWRRPKHLRKLVVGYPLSVVSHMVTLLYRDVSSLLFNYGLGGVRLSA